MNNSNSSKGNRDYKDGVTNPLKLRRLCCSARALLLQHGDTDHFHADPERKTARALSFPLIPLHSERAARGPPEAMLYGLLLPLAALLLLRADGRRVDTAVSINNNNNNNNDESHNNHANPLDSDKWMSGASHYDKEKYWNRFRDVLNIEVWVVSELRPLESRKLANCAGLWTCRARDYWWTSLA
ncbi:hypothetical protein MHYP_G00175560 [Metynnis hypsauchen]